MFFSIALGLVGGLGLFLYGMKQMSSGIQQAAGDKLRRILEILTTNPVMATLTGIGITVLVQSSSTTHVMVVAFTNSGLMTLSQALGTMLGANIGTTVTAQIISFDITGLIFPTIGVGAALNLFGTKRLHKSIGQGIIGFGLLFLGLRTMSDAMHPLRDFPLFLDLLASFGQTPVLGVLIGALFTALVQSSSATTGVVIALTLQGIIDTPSAISIMLGANIGTSITAALASIGTNLTARRAVLGIIFVKVAGVLLALVLFRPFVTLISYTGTSVTRQVANAHTLFNVFNVVAFYPFMKPFLKIITRILPGEVRAIESGTSNLNKRILRSTPAAISASRQEILRMARISREMLEDSIHILLHHDRGLIGAAMQKEDLIDSLEKDITTYLAEIAQSSLSEQQSQTVTSLMHVCSDLERIGDHAENIIQLAEAKMEEDLSFSSSAMDELQHMYRLVDKMLEEATTAFEKEDIALAYVVISNDHEVDFMERELRKSHTGRLNQGVCIPKSGVIFLDIISNLERVADHATNLAEVVTGDF